MQVADVKLKLALDSSLYIWNWRVTLLFIFADVINGQVLVINWPSDQTDHVSNHHYFSSGISAASFNFTPYGQYIPKLFEVDR